MIQRHKDFDEKNAIISDAEKVIDTKFIDKIRILQFSQSRYNSAVVDVKCIGTWDGYDVWEPIFKETLFLGLPVTVLVKGNDIRLTKGPKETFAAYYESI